MRSPAQVSIIWTQSLNSETRVSVRTRPAPTLSVVFTTLLTKRRAVDHCLVRSSLCCMS
jgi:hypothetical protein